MRKTSIVLTVLSFLQLAHSAIAREKQVSNKSRLAAAVKCIETIEAVEPIEVDDSTAVDHLSKLRKISSSDYLLVETYKEKHGAFIFSKERANFSTNPDDLENLNGLAPEELNNEFYINFFSALYVEIYDRLVKLNKQVATLTPDWVQRHTAIVRSCSKITKSRSKDSRTKDLIKDELETLRKLIYRAKSLMRSQIGRKINVEDLKDPPPSKKRAI